MKHLIAFEVDSIELFDMVAKVKDGGSAIGQRLVEVLLAPKDVGFTTHLGMRIYGVTLKSVEAASPPTATQDPDHAGGEAR